MGVKDDIDGISGGTVMGFEAPGGCPSGRLQEVVVGSEGFPPFDIADTEFDDSGDIDDVGDIEGAI